MVFVSFGEIDCRANEGVIKTSKKTGRAYNEIIDQTVEGYIGWFLNENKINKHTYFFFNIPAPVYDSQYSRDINEKVAEIVTLFNSSLLVKTSYLQAKMVDVYSLTVGKKVFQTDYTIVINII